MSFKFLTFPPSIVFYSLIRLLLLLQFLYKSLISLVLLYHAFSNEPLAFTTYDNFVTSHYPSLYEEGTHIKSP